MVDRDLLVNRELLKLEFERAGWIFPSSIWNNLSDYEKSFMIFEFTGKRTLSNYINRLKYIGFEGLNTVLDAGCGMGQWSVALSYLNKKIVGIDLNRGRLCVAVEVANKMGRKNCNFFCGRLENLPFESETFDGIFCYGVLMFTDIPKTLSEFYRVLKPSGKCYLNANTIGWYMHLIIDRGLKNKNIRIMIDALNMVVRTILRKKSFIVVTKNWLMRELKERNFEIIDIGAEGETSFKKEVLDHKPEPFYPKSHYGFVSILEVLVVKK